MDSRQTGSVSSGSPRWEGRALGFPVACLHPSPCLRASAPEGTRDRWATGRLRELAGIPQAGLTASGCTPGALGWGGPYTAAAQGSMAPFPRPQMPLSFPVLSPLPEIPPQTLMLLSVPGLCPWCGWPPTGLFERLSLPFP